MKYSEIFDILKQTDTNLSNQNLPMAATEGIILQASLLILSLRDKLGSIFSLDITDNVERLPLHDTSWEDIVTLHISFVWYQNNFRIMLTKKEGKVFKQDRLQVTVLNTKSLSQKFSDELYDVTLGCILKEHFPKTLYSNENIITWEEDNMIHEKFELLSQQLANTKKN